MRENDTLAFLDPSTARLPGVVPLDAADWITAPDGIADELAYRDHLIETQRVDVLGHLADGVPPAAELLDVLVSHLSMKSGWRVAENEIVRPDGVEVQIDRSDPLEVIGRLVSEDFCILQKRQDGQEYILVAAALCFPAVWALTDKIGLPLSAIHSPVPHYDLNVAKRVNRIFDGIRADQLLLRYNWSITPYSELHATPARLACATPAPDGPFLRVERQTFRRLPQTGAVAFGIATTLNPIASLPRADVATLLRTFDAQSQNVSDYKLAPDHQSNMRHQLADLAGVN